MTNRDQPQVTFAAVAVNLCLSKFVDGSAWVVDGRNFLETRLFSPVSPIALGTVWRHAVTSSGSVSSVRAILALARTSLDASKAAATASSIRADR